jgi:uncharacterized protein YebE (UPF0316 family)
MQNAYRKILAISSKIEYILLCMDEELVLERLDKIISLLEVANKQPSILVRIGNGVATGAGILGLISVIDIIKAWLGG